MGSVGFVGGAGGDVIGMSPSNISPTATGAVSQLSTNITGTLTWSKVSGSTNITIASSTGFVTATAALGVAGTNSFVARVANAAGDAVEKSFTLTGVAVPDAPTITLTTGDGQVSMNITDGSNNGATITAHKIYRSTTTGTEVLIGTYAGASPYVDSGVTNGTTYFYKVSAVNSVGEGSQSSEVSGTPNVVLGNFKAAVAAVRAGTGNASIWFQGDSLTAGESAGWAYNGNLSNSFVGGWPYTLPHLLAADYTAQAGGAGCNAVETGIIGTQLQTAATYPPYDTRVDFGSWTGAASVGYMASTGAGTMFTYNFGVPANRVDFVMRNTLAGAFDVYALDGTTLLGTLSADTTNATTFQSLTIPAGSTGIKLNYNSGTPQIYTIQPINTLVKQMYIYKNGWPANALTNTAISATSTKCAPRNIIANIRPSLVIIDSYVNEASTSVTQTAYKAAVQGFIDTAKTAGCDVLLVMGSWTSNAGVQAAVPNYIQWLQDLATLNNVPFFNLQLYPGFRTYTEQSSAPYSYMDGGGTHLNTAGYAAKETYLRQFLGLA